MTDKRDAVIDQAADFYLARDPRDRDIADTMADFALSREADVRRQIADELAEIAGKPLFKNALARYIKELRGNK